MSRYYKIAIYPIGSSQPWVSPSLKGLGVTDASYTSVINGQTNGSALDIEINMPIFTFDTPRQGARLRIYGVTLGEAAQAFNLQGSTIAVWAGMNNVQSLPLSLQFSPDLLVYGTIWQVSGNWEGTQTFLDIVIVPLFGDNATPATTPNAKLAFTWGPPPNDDLIAQLRKTVQATYPDYDVKGAVSPNLKPVENNPGTFDNLSALADWLKKHTDGRMKGSPTASIPTVVAGLPYSGVEFFTKDKVIYVSDNSQDTSPSSKSSISNPTEIDFPTLIGQPAWKTAFTINFKTIMRGDISVLDYIKLPDILKSPYVLTPPSAGGVPEVPMPSRESSTFQGVFQVTEMTHLGRFRGNQGGDWVTSFDADSLEPMPNTPVQQGTIPTPEQAQPPTLEHAIPPPPPLPPPPQFNRRRNFAR